MSNYILVLKDEVENDKISVDALVVYIAIFHKSFHVTSAFLSYSWLEWAIFNRPADKTERGMIVGGLNELIEKGYVQVIDKLRNNGFICDISKIKVYDKEKYYLSISPNEFRSIIKINDVNKYKILKYYLLLTGTFDASSDCKDTYRFKIGKISQNLISVILNISVPTINKYNKILEENKVLYISRDKAKCLNKGINGVLYKQEVNLYSRYEDRELCDRYARESKREKQKNIDKYVVNDDRKYVQMFNIIKKYAKNGEKYYDEDKSFEIFEYMKDWNKRKMLKFEEDRRNGLNPKKPELKNLPEAFKCYDFMKEIMSKKNDAHD